MFDEKYKSYSSSFSSLPCYLALCRHNIFLSSLFPETFSLRSSLNLSNQGSEIQFIAHICLFIRRVVKSYRSWRVRLLLTLNTLTCKIWWAPNNARRWQMEFNSAFKELNSALQWCALFGSLLAYRGKFLPYPIRRGLDWPQGRKNFWAAGERNL